MEAWLEGLGRLGLQQVRLGEPMANHTSIRVGGPADALVEPASVEELSRLLAFARTHAVPVRVIGAGSNLLVRDGGMTGIVAKIWKPLGEIRFAEDRGGASGRVYAQAGAPLPKLARLASDRRLGGLEFAGGIPGTVGGAVTMNAGAHGGETATHLIAAELLDDRGRLHVVPKAELHFRYRHSLMHEDRSLVVVGAEFELPEDDPAAIRERMRAYAKRRKTTQPLGEPSSGSMFKNPPGDYAARLIEAAGLKGTACGGISVSTLHANFMLNDGTGTAADVAALIRRVQAEVHDRFDVELELEVEWTGRAREES
ncbi:MAG TPA: UDP-N-acetylmuramate dehydrogenase [Limnochordia bacterium]|nr:UDP-N-acetylmuramate dehydrogenase [Limnochordia bacterium]